MNISMMLDQPAEAGDRVAVKGHGRSLTRTRLRDLARAAAGRFPGLRCT